MMMGWTVRAGVVATLTATATMAFGQAGGPPQAGVRGVIVVRAEAPPADPTPAPPPKPAPIAQPLAMRTCPRPFAGPDLLAVGGGTEPRAFDKALAAKLRAARTPVVVDLAQPFAVDAEAPAALRPWFAQVKAAGGLLTVDEYCQPSRGLFGSLGRLLGMGGDKRYAEAARYDVVLHADGGQSRVTQVEFRRRGG